jgi:hypothetical protein
MLVWMFITAKMGQYVTPERRQTSSRLYGVTFNIIGPLSMVALSNPARVASLQLILLKECLSISVPCEHGNVPWNHMKLSLGLINQTAWNEDLQNSGGMAPHIFDTGTILESLKE